MIQHLCNHDDMSSYHIHWLTEMIHQLCNHGAMCSDHNHWLTEMIQHYGNHGDMLSDHNHWLTDDTPRCDVYQSEPLANRNDTPIM